MTITRRHFVNGSLGAFSILSSASLLAQEDKPNPKSSRFLLYVHFGSSCGAANGLIQPLSPGKWPLGLFQSGIDSGANNPLLNSHTAAGSLVFHDYMKFLAPMASDMCLVSGSSQSLDHNVASLLQKRGGIQASSSPEWSMGVSQFMQTDARRNPMIISAGSKASSTPDISIVSSNSIENFKQITSDVKAIPQKPDDPIRSVLMKRYAQYKSSTVNIDPSLAQISNAQITTLAQGLPELGMAQADINTLRAKLAGGEVNRLVAGSAEASEIAREADDSMREQLILAGTLAKTGLASGMTIDVLGEDLHFGGSDVDTARRAAGKWALLSLFWEWIRSVNLEDDVMIIVSQEFARSPYNSASVERNITNASGASVKVISPGRDHALAMGMMFINGNVPSAGRVGIIGGNMVAQGTKDTKGTVDPALEAYTSTNIVGSMLMRCFGELFPTERIVRRHWPAFKEIAAILA